jgi:hypothetical protein
MKATARSKSSKVSRSDTASAKQKRFKKFAAAFGPKPEIEPRKTARAGAVELLIKLRRGKA